MITQGEKMLIDEAIQYFKALHIGYCVFGYVFGIATVISVYRLINLI